MALSLTGCTHEGPHTGCDEGSLNLLFTYDGNTAGFDQTIAEDIELYLYDDQGKKMNERDRKSTRLNSSHTDSSRMPSSA